MTVQKGNALPTAVAGVDQSKNEGDSVTLSAAGSSDPELTTLSYAWVRVSGPAVALTGAGFFSGSGAGSGSSPGVSVSAGVTAGVSAGVTAGGGPGGMGGRLRTPIR